MLCGHPRVRGRVPMLYQYLLVLQGGVQMKAITKTDIKRARRAIKIADQGNDYELITWAFGEIEDILNKAEKALEKEGK